MSGGFARPEALGTGAMLGGYWISQMLASYFVVGALIGASSKMAGALCFGLFAVLFVLHSLRPWSRTAAILGLCSFGTFAALTAYMARPWFVAYVPSVELMVLISAGLAIWGIAVDAFHPIHL